MSTKNISEHVADLTNMAKMYLSTHVRLMKLDALERSSRTGVFFLRSCLMILFIAFILLFLSFAFSFWYGRTFDDYVTGFLISAGFHAVLGAVVLLLRKYIIHAPVIRSFAKIFFDTNNEN
jgi:hypothetical protein